MTKGSFTRDEWNHLLCLFNISHFSSTVCSAAMAKGSQQDSGEERVTAKSRPMMNLIARTPSHVSSSTSVSPEKKSSGNQDLWSAKAEKEERSGRPDIGIDRKKASDHYYHEQFMESFSSASYSKWDDDRVWSSQKWKADKSMDDRTGQPVVTSLGKSTPVRIKFLSREDPARWKSAIHCERGIPRDRPGQTRCHPSKRNKATAIRHWKR